MTNVLYIHESARMSGAENSLLALIRNLDRGGFSPLFVLPEKGGLSDELERMGVRCAAIPMPPVRALAGVRAAARAIAKVAKDAGAGIIHSNSIRTNIYGSMAGVSLHVPVIWHERNLLTGEAIDPDRLFSFLPDKIICNSKAIAARFGSGSGWPDKVRVVYNGVDTAAFSPSVSGAATRAKYGIKDKDIVIGIASRFNPDKGHETFFDASAMILKDLPELSGRVRLLVAGGAVFEEDRTREQYVREYAARRGLGGNTVFTGVVGDMPGIYAAMDLLVLSSWAEPCGRVIFEAMSSGRPVVGTDSGGTPEIIEDGSSGLLFRPKDASALAAALKGLVLDDRRRLSMGQSARKRIEENFTIQINVKKTEEIYAEALGRGKK